MRDAKVILGRATHCGPTTYRRADQQPAVGAPNRLTPRRTIEPRDLRDDRRLRDPFRVPRSMRPSFSWRGASVRVQAGTGTPWSVRKTGR